MLTFRTFSWPYCPEMRRAMICNTAFDKNRPLTFFSFHVQRNVPLKLASVSLDNPFKECLCEGVGGGVAGGNPGQRGRDQALPLRNHGGPSQGIYIFVAF